MKSPAAIIGFLLLSGLSAAAGTGDDHPIEKVINMLQGLKAKVEVEAKVEAVAYTKFEYWCQNSIKTLEKAIAEEKDTIDSLESKIDAATQEVKTLTKKIADLEEEIGKMDAAAAKAKEVRDEAAALYAEVDADYGKTIDAVLAAIAALKQANEKTEAGLLQGAQRLIRKVLLLVQVSAEDVDLSALKAFLQQKPRPELEAAGDSEGHVDVYKFKSGSVIELLKGLAKKFEDEKLAATKAETNSLNANSLAKDARDNARKAAEDSKTECEGNLGDAKAELAEAEGSLKTTQENLAADTASLEDTQKSCAMKKSEWDERCKTRDLELQAMDAAVKILAKVGGVRTEAPSNPILPPSPLAAGEPSDEILEEIPTFLQVDDPKMKAVNLLLKEAHASHSKALERLAQEIAAHLSGPFDEVTNMIEKMIFRLMAEQKDEDDHKNWCDKEIEKTNTSKTDKEDKIDELSVKIDDAQAAVAKHAEDIKDANDMVAKITGFMKEATEIRNIGKEENKQAIKDAQEAQTAISNAVAVLEDFYKNSGAVPKEEWEFVQQPVSLPETPSTWDAGYTGVSDPKAQPAGIISILEQTSADFSKMQSETQAQEATDQSEFDEEMKANDIERARRSKEAEVKTAESKRLNAKITSWSEERKRVSDELEAVMQYIKDLQPACVEGDSTYEDRKANRAKEIAALKEAQGILADAFKEQANATQTDSSNEPLKEAPLEEAAPEGLVAKRVRHLRAHRAPRA